MPARAKEKAGALAARQARSVEALEGVNDALDLQVAEGA